MINAVKHSRDVAIVAGFPIALYVQVFSGSKLTGHVCVPFEHMKANEPTRIAWPKGSTAMRYRVIHVHGENADISATPWRDQERAPNAPYAILALASGNVTDRDT